MVPKQPLTDFALKKVLEVSQIEWYQNITNCFPSAPVVLEVSQIEWYQNRTHGGIYQNCVLEVSQIEWYQNASGRDR